MYEEFYQFKERPFSLSPDPDFLYLGKSHSKAMNILRYGVMSDASITVISGEIGTGKTTLVQNLLRDLDDQVTVGLLTHTQHNFGDLIKWVLSSFNRKIQETDQVRLYQEFIDFITEEYRAGRRVVLIIDEAHNLSLEALEDIRMLTNVNVGKDLILQLILVGQPELIETLHRKELRQLTQRISIDYFLEPLGFSETKNYVMARLEKAGGNPDLFAPTALATVYYHSGGIPRVINTICELALVYGFAEARKKITKDLVLKALRDRKIGGLTAEDNSEKSARAQDLREEIIRKTGVDIADLS